MDGTGVTTPTDPGAGRVNCEYGVDSLAKFKLHKQADGSYVVESLAYPNVFLRMDGGGVISSGASGTVNCQFGQGPWEVFNARAQANGSFAFESVAFPGVFLGMVADGVTVSSGPGGRVQCVGGSGAPTTMFFLNMADQNLVFAMLHQEQTMWCWNASSVSIAKYYNANSAWTQGTLANSTFGRNDCVVAAGQVSP